MVNLLTPKNGLHCDTRGLKKAHFFRSVHTPKRGNIFEHHRTDVGMFKDNILIARAAIDKHLSSFHSNVKLADKIASEIKSSKDAESIAKIQKLRAKAKSDYKKAQKAFQLTVENAANICLEGLEEHNYERFLDYIKWVVHGDQGFSGSSKIDLPVESLLVHLTNETHSQGLQNILNSSDPSYLKAYYYALCDQDKSNQSATNVKLFLETDLGNSERSEKFDKIARLASIQSLCADSLLRKFVQSQRDFHPVTHARMLNAAFEILRIEHARTDDVKVQVKLLLSVFEKAKNSFPVTGMSFFSRVNLKSILSASADEVIRANGHVDSFSNNLINLCYERWKADGFGHVGFELFENIGDELQGEYDIISRIQKELKNSLFDADEKVSESVIGLWVPRIRSTLFKFSSSQQKRLILALQKNWKDILFLDDETREWFLGHLKVLLRERPSLDISALSVSSEYANLLRIQKQAANSRQRALPLVCLMAGLVVSGIDIYLISVGVVALLFFKVMASQFAVRKDSLSFLTGSSNQSNTWLTFLSLENLAKIFSPRLFGSQGVVLAGILASSMLFFPHLFANASLYVLAFFAVPVVLQRLYLCMPCYEMTSAVPNKSVIPRKVDLEVSSQHSIYDENYQQGVVKQRESIKKLYSPKKDAVVKKLDFDKVGSVEGESSVSADKSTLSA